MIRALASVRRLSLAIAAMSVLGGCLSAAPQHPPAAESPKFRPEVFFAGRTQGTGQLEARGRAPRAMNVEGFGRSEPDGAFRLEQTVRFADGETEKRTWVMRKTEDDRYTATLSDASGEVAAEVRGNVFHLRYLIRRPAVYMEQWLYLQPDRRSVVNLGTVTVAGVPWARLSERIECVSC